MKTRGSNPTACKFTSPSVRPTEASSAFSSAGTTLPLKPTLRPAKSAGPEMPGVRAHHVALVAALAEEGHRPHRQLTLAAPQHLRRGGRGEFDLPLQQ